MYVIYNNSACGIRVKDICRALHFRKPTGFKLALYTARLKLHSYT